jgi:hypothetical protein
LGNKKEENMKKLLLTLTLITIGIATVWAQQGRPERFDHEQFKSNKIAFITQALNLKPAEAEKFWPIYNQFENERNKLFDQRREMERMIMERSDNLSEKEYTELSRKFAALFKEEGDLTQRYNEQFLKILPAKKVVELYKAEYNFRKELLRQYRNRPEDKR